MKLETELKPGDIVLLKVLACILILFFTCISRVGEEPGSAE